MHDVQVVVFENEVMGHGPCSEATAEGRVPLHSKPQGRVLTEIDGDL